MKNRLSIIFMLFLFLVSCQNSRNRDSATSNIMPEMTNDGRVDLCPDLNEIALFSNNSFLFYKHISIDSFLAVWGNAKYGRVQYDTLHMFPSRLPILEWSNDEVICLRQGCGTSCFFAYVMIFQSGEIKQYMYPMAYDTVNNYIAYSVDNSDGFLIVENLLTGKKQEITESYDRQLGPLSINAIDNINFSSGGLYVKWRGEQSQSLERIFEIFK